MKYYFKIYLQFYGGMISAKFYLIFNAGLRQREPNASSTRAHTLLRGLKSGPQAWEKGSVQTLDTNDVSGVKAKGGNGG